MKSIFFLLALLNASLLYGQKAADEKTQWWNPAQQNFHVLEGQVWPNEVKNPYDRFPARAE